MQRLVLGEGPNSIPEPDKIRVDIVPEWSDICLDVAKNPLPMEDNSFDYVEAHHIAEHIQLNDDFLRFMNEMHRVVKVGGIVDITVPHKDCHSAWECYQHTRFFTENSFVNFYHNEFAEEMGIKLFRCLVAEKRQHGDGIEVHVSLTKDLI